MTPPATRPIIWSIAGLDTAGGAGLSADQRAADALDCHLCPVAASLTAQHSMGVEAVFPVASDALQAQLSALATDMPPRAVKTGLLGSVAAVHAVAAWVDRLRARAPANQDPHRFLPLVVDPVLGASAGGQGFASDAVVAAYRTHLLPRATLITPNRAEALRLLGEPGGHDVAQSTLPQLAQRLLHLGARGVVITGGDAPAADHTVNQWCLDWLDTPHAQGWLCAPRVDTPHNHGTGCTFATAAASALAHGHVSADAVVLANMVTRQALRHAHAAGQGAGPVKAHPSLQGAMGPQGERPVPWPWLGLGQGLPWQLTHATAGQAAPTPLFAPYTPPADRLYGILADASQLHQALAAGLRCVQLRHKSKPGLPTALAQSLEAAAHTGAQLFINDHWEDALSATANWTPTASPNGFAMGVHLGQEDLLALSPAQQAQLLCARHRLMLGLSTHSLWELARAAGCGASYIACGPVQATTTKDMPWHPQGEQNLRWWLAHSPAPVVAIGGLLTADDVRRFAQWGPAAVCVVRGLGDGPEMAARVKALQTAAQVPTRDAPMALPHPVL